MLFLLFGEERCGSRTGLYRCRLSFRKLIRTTSQRLGLAVLTVIPTILLMPSREGFSATDLRG